MKILLDTREIDLATDLPTLKKSVKKLLDNLLFKLNASSSGDADTVDGFHAFATATANALLALDSNAKLPTSITGDANTTGGFYAKQTPTANAISVADSSGKLNIGWLNFGEFSATMSANQTISTATWTTVAFNSVICNPYNNYNSSSYCYVAPANGYYFFSTTVRWNTPVYSSGYVWQMAFYRNGSQIRPVWDFGGSGYTVSGTISTICYLLSGNYVDVRVYQNYSSTAQVSSSSVFCGFRIS